MSRRKKVIRLTETQLHQVIQRIVKEETNKEMKVIKLKESDIHRMVKRVLNEQFLTKEEENISDKVSNKKRIEPSDIPSDAHQSLKDCIKKYNRLLSWYEEADSEKIRHDRSNDIIGLDCMEEFRIGL